MSYDFGGKLVFLSGPMTGKPGWNREAFADAEAWCRDHGAIEVYNPARLSPEAGERVHPHERYMTRTLHELTKFAPRLDDVDDWFRPLYDAVVMLPGWMDSDGACVERNVALACGIDVVMYEEVTA